MAGALGRRLLLRLLSDLGFEHPENPFSPANSVLGHFSIVLLLRVLMLLGASVRLAVHRDDYLQHEFIGRVVLVTLFAYACYVAVLVLVRGVSRRRFVSEPSVFTQILLDVSFSAAFYFVTLNLESDFFLFFLIPVLLMTGDHRRLKGALTLVLPAACLLALVRLIPLHFPQPERSGGFATDILRVFAPRMLLLTGFWALVNVLLKYQRDASHEYLERKALRDVLDAERRRRVQTEQAHAKLTERAASAERPADARRAESFRPAGAQEPIVGQTLAGRYQVLNMVESGGKVEGYLANDMLHEDLVAIKVLPPKVFRAGSRELVTMHELVGKAHRIASRNVIQIHSLTEIDWLRFLVLEHVAGGSLRPLLTRQYALGFLPGLHIVKQVSAGLIAVHEAGMLHRDLRPENILLLPSGVVKLMPISVDQIARAPGDTADVPSESAPYMSPEQLENSELDERSDVYALGVVMHEVFTGRRPSAKRSVADGARAQTAPAPQAQSTTAPGIPAELDRIIQRCLQPRREDRPPSAAAVHQALASEIPEREIMKHVKLEARLRRADPRAAVSSTT